MRGCIDQIDHLDVVPEYEYWGEVPHGLLMVSSDRGRTKLALFQGAPQGSRETVGFHLVAFRVGAVAFAEFLRRLPGLDLTDERQLNLPLNDRKCFGVSHSAFHKRLSFKVMYTSLL